MNTQSTLDIETLSQFDYTKKILESEDLGYIGKGQFTNDYTQKTMDTFIGTKAQCDAKFESCKNAAELAFKERAKKINIRSAEIRDEWFDHHTADLTTSEKTFVQRLVDKLSMEVEDAIDRVEEFTDLLK